MSSKWDGKGPRNKIRVLRLPIFQGELSLQVSITSLYSPNLAWHWWLVTFSWGWEWMWHHSPTAAFVRTCIWMCVCMCVCDSMWLSGKESVGNAGDMNLILGWQGTLEEETATNSSILTIDRGSWQATIHGIDKSQAWLSRLACTHTY